ncbi:MAG: uroporphyrinogen-III C-methyltransferase [Acidimicrobiaceae bacterium]|nr:uroporphyrinogen-III C-methyltransferase [Acidimicrobiaceae bacterium]
MTVYLVGAGPGACDLLTVRAARILKAAHVVVHDRLIDPSVLALIGPGTLRIDVGKSPGAATNQEQINELLVQLSRVHERVVRLKGGDPFVFGRGGEEALALRAAQVACEIVPGVTSALAGPMAAGIPVTQRGIAKGVCVVTGHLAHGDDDYLRRVAHPEVTVVILMGVSRRGEIAKRLMEGGLLPSTPVAVIERAWTSSQRVVRGRLDRLAHLEVRSPAIIVVGEASALDVVSVITEEVLVH